MIDIDDLIALSPNERAELEAMDAEERGERATVAKSIEPPEPAAVVAPVPEPISAPVIEADAQALSEDEPIPYKVADIKPLQAALDAAKLELADIEAKADSGDLSATEAMRASNKVTLSIGELSADIKNAQRRAEENEQNAVTWRDRTLDRFLTNPANAIYKAGSVPWLTMDAKMKALDADTANAGKSLTWFLREADKQARAELSALGMTLGKADAPAPVATAPGIDRKQTVPVPATLATMPSAAAEEIGSEFAYIDNLRGIAAEQAINRLTDEQRYRYESLQ